MIYRLFVSLTYISFLGPSTHPVSCQDRTILQEKILLQFFSKCSHMKLLQEENVQPSRGTRPELHRLHGPLWDPGERERSPQCWILLHILPNSWGHLPRHHLWSGLRPGQHHQEEEVDKGADLSREERRGWAELCGSLNGRSFHLLLPHLHSSSKHCSTSSLWSETLCQPGNICFSPDLLCFSPFLYSSNGIPYKPGFGVALEKVP